MAESRLAIDGPIGKHLFTEDFDRLSHMLWKWRQDPTIRLMDKEKDPRRVLPFVKGLRFSAQVAYLVRKILSGMNLHVNWGHLVDERGDSCSPECDIIVHTPGYVQRWNGGEQPIMDFNFIECSQARAVISCKSLVTSVDPDYCKGLAEYKVKNIFLFAECCPSDSIDRLRSAARKAGYIGLYYLYALEEGSPYCQQDERVYADFVSAIKGIGNPRKVGAAKRRVKHKK